MRAVDTEGNRRFHGSICVKYDVRRVPLKPEVDFRKEPELARVLEESRDGMINFCPWSIIDENIGSNRGLLVILKNFAQERRDEKHLSFVNTDCNIFMRCLKVININKYTPSLSSM